MSALSHYALVAWVCCMLLAFASSASENVEVAVDSNGDVVHDSHLKVAHDESIARTEERAHVDGSHAAPDQPPSITESGGVNAAVESPSLISKVRADNGPLAMLTVLHSELEAVNHMLKLQEKKLEVLGDVRAAWMKEYEAEVAQHSEDIETSRPKTHPDFRDLIHRKLDSELSYIATEAVERAFDTSFIEEAVTPLEGPVVDVKLMKLRAPSVLEMVVVAYNNGMVVFYVTPNVEVLRLDTDRRGISSIALSTQEGQPCLAVAYEGSVVVIYALELTGNGRHLIGTKSSSGRLEAHKAPEFASPSGSNYNLRVTQLSRLQLSAAMAVINIARIAQDNTVVVAQTDGAIEFFALNGTRLHQLQTAASIQTLETRRNMLAFSNGMGVTVALVTRDQEGEFQFCPASSAPVTSVAFDAEHPDILYAGTERGEVLVYMLRAATPGGVQVCRLHSRVFISQRKMDQAPATLVVAKGYLLAAVSSQITVFNVSRTSPLDITLVELCTRSLSQFGDAKDPDTMRAPIVAYSESPHSSKLAFVVTGQGNRPVLTLLHSLLGSNKTAPDLEWTGVFYAVAIVMVVLGIQYYFRRQHADENIYDAVKRKHGLDLDPYGCKYGGASVQGIPDIIRNNRRQREQVDEESLTDYGSPYDSLSDDLKQKIARAKSGVTQDLIDDAGF